MKNRSLLFPEVVVGVQWLQPGFQRVRKACARGGEEGGGRAGTNRSSHAFIELWIFMPFFVQKKTSKLKRRVIALELLHF